MSISKSSLLRIVKPVLLAGVIVAAIFWLSSVDATEKAARQDYENAVVLSKCSENAYWELIKEIKELSELEPNTEIDRNQLHQAWLDKCEALRVEAPTGQAFLSSVAAVVATLFGLLAWMFPDFWKR